MVPTESDGWTSPLGPVPSEVAILPLEGVSGLHTGDSGHLAAVRTHQIAITSDPDGTPARVVDTRFLGGSVSIHLRLVPEAGGYELVLHATADQPAPIVGASVGICWSHAVAPVAY